MRSTGARAPFQYPIRRLIVRSREASKPRDLYLEFSDRPEISQTHRQHCCGCACQISKRCDSLNCQSRGFETSRDLMRRSVIGYWNGSLIFKAAWQGTRVEPQQWPPGHVTYSLGHMQGTNRANTDDDVNCQSIAYVIQAHRKLFVLFTAL